MVNRAVVLPFSGVTPVTVAPETPHRTRSVGWSEAGSNGREKLTSSVNGPGRVKTPLPGGVVEVTASGAGAYRKLPANPTSAADPSAGLIAPPARAIVWSPSAVTGLVANVNVSVS